MTQDCLLRDDSHSDQEEFKKKANRSAMMQPKGNHAIRIAALADLHVGHADQSNYADLFEMIAQDADMLLFCGNLTDHGLPEEAKVVQYLLRSCSILVLAVLGNHDYESNQAEAMKQLLLEAHVRLLGTAVGGSG
jgi:uncharacterized protein